MVARASRPSMDPPGHLGEVYQDAFPGNHFPIDPSDDDFDYDSEEEEDTPDFYPTCGLCRFYFEPGDPVFGSVGKNIPFRWKGEYTVPVVEPRRDGERAFHIKCVDLVDSCISVWDDHRVRFNPYLHRMSMISGSIPYFIQPPRSFTNQRDRWLRNSVTHDLQHALGGRLPPEICRTIASYCTQERATQIIRDLWLGHGRRYETSMMIPLDDTYDAKSMMIPLDGNHPLWIRYTEMEGLRYVESISRIQQHESDELFFSPDDYAGSPFNIYFAEDHRGIRQIIITESDAPPSINRAAGLHWAICCRHQKLPFCLRFKSDGIKLRDFVITNPERPSPKWDLRRWATFPRNIDTFPPPPSICDGYDRNLSYYDAIQAIDWNAPDICGYYFYITDGELRGIVAVKEQDSRTSHVDEYQHGHLGNVVGIYFPMGHGERVSEIWLRTGEYGDDAIEADTMILRTNKDRSCVLGLDTSSFWLRFDSKESKKFTYKKLASFPPVGRTRMFYSRSGHCKTWLAFEKPTNLEVWLGHGEATTWSGEIEVSLPFPHDEPTSNNIFCNNYLVASAPLHGVRSVTPCRAWGKDFSGDTIVGLLLTYLDGSQRCVGLVRPDHLEAPMEVRSGKIWLGSRKWKGERIRPGPLIRTIKCVRVIEPEPPENNLYEYLEVQMSGRLDWYFDHVVSCGLAPRTDVDERPDEMKEVLDRQSHLRESNIRAFEVESWPVRK
ncbi:hypothetical protein NW766_004550 [Fusarium irregulare]|uniref:Uncharacterized protein n=1 Tax=Fusarium irregulare TaxID=2494466 RepID=A0A9W8PTE0_9HYPO|nr:hypothetical protein NW766_004550 [Fusarium irregulare]